MSALMDLASEVNAMQPVYTMKLGFHVRKINVNAEKIDRSYLDIFGMVIIDLLVKNKLGRAQFFRKTFLLANIGLELVLKMLFLILSRADIWFAEQKLVWKTYTTIETLPMTKIVEIIDKRKFAVVALNTDNKTLVVHKATIAEPTTMPIHPSC